MTFKSYGQFFSFSATTVQVAMKFDTDIHGPYMMY